MKIKRLYQKQDFDTALDKLIYDSIIVISQQLTF